MKFTIDWLKQHLETKYNEEKIIDKLTNVGLEVESFENQSSEYDEFVIARIITYISYSVVRSTVGSGRVVI